MSFICSSVAKNRLFWFFAFGLWVGKNQMCLFARWLFQHVAQLTYIRTKSMEYILNPYVTSTFGWRLFLGGIFYKSS